jgi:hypothetical protein
VQAFRIEECSQEEASWGGIACLMRPLVVWRNTTREARTPAMWTRRNGAVSCARLFPGRTNEGCRNAHGLLTHGELPFLRTFRVQYTGFVTCVGGLVTFYCTASDNYENIPSESMDNCTAENVQISYWYHTHLLSARDILCPDNNGTVVST